MTNERLRNAMTVAHIDIDTITKVTNVDPKTVQRWLMGVFRTLVTVGKLQNCLRNTRIFSGPPTIRLQLVNIPLRSLQLTLIAMKYCLMCGGNYSSNHKSRLIYSATLCYFYPSKIQVW